MEETIIVKDKVPEMRADIKKKRRRRDFILGIFIILLAIIGLINIVIFGVRATGNLLNNTRQKERWESFVLPVVMVNPVPFEGASNLEQVTLQEIGIYASLVNRKVDSFQTDEQGYVVIPQSEVDDQIKTLFGSGVSITHETSGAGFSDSIIDDVYTPSAPTTFIYDESTQSYHINLAEILTGDMYIPKVLDIEKQDNQIVLTVGYMLQDALWDGEETIKNRQPDRGYRYYISTDEQGNKYISKTEIAEEYSLEVQNATQSNGTTPSTNNSQDETLSSQAAVGAA